MIIVKNNIGKSLVRLLMTLNVFNKNYAVLKWDNSFVLTRTKPVDKLIANQITKDNILTLKFKYHSSHSIMAEYTAEVKSHLHDKKQLLLNIWTNEQKEKLIRKDTLNLTDETNFKFHELLNKKVFNEKYGDNYRYFLSVHMHPDIVNAKSKEQTFSELTLKHSLKPENKKNEMRHKTKFSITKDEAKEFCSKVSYWKK